MCGKDSIPLKIDKDIYINAFLESNGVSGFEPAVYGSAISSNGFEPAVYSSTISSNRF